MNAAGGSFIAAMRVARAGMASEAGEVYMYFMISYQVAQKKFFQVLWEWSNIFCARVW